MGTRVRQGRASGRHANADAPRVLPWPPAKHGERAPRDVALHAVGLLRSRAAPPPLGLATREAANVLRRAPHARGAACRTAGAGRHAPSACARTGLAPGSPRTPLGTQSSPSHLARDREADGEPWWAKPRRRCAQSRSAQAQEGGGFSVRAPPAGRALCRPPYALAAIRACSSTEHLCALRSPTTGALPQAFDRRRMRSVWLPSAARTLRAIAQACTRPARAPAAGSALVRPWGVKPGLPRHARSATGRGVLTSAALTPARASHGAFSTRNTNSPPCSRRSSTAARRSAAAARATASSWLVRPSPPRTPRRQPRAPSCGGRLPLSRPACDRSDRARWASRAPPLQPPR